MKFTVFGAQGFIGTYLVKHLLRAGHEVLTPAREECIDHNRCLGNVIYAIGLTGDFRNRPYETVDAHVTKLARVLEGGRYDSLLYMSSTRLYGSLKGVVSESDEISIIPNADGIYNISKLLGESLCLGIDHPNVRVARLANVYGFGQSKHTFLGSLLDDVALGRNIVITEAPESCKDYISISDVVILLEQIALKGRHKIYNLATGKSISHQMIGDRIKRFAGVPVDFLDNGLHRVFPAINIYRITSEFNFQPKNLLDEIDQLIESYKIIGKG